MTLYVIKALDYMTLYCFLLPQISDRMNIKYMIGINDRNKTFVAKKEGYVRSHEVEVSKKATSEDVAILIRKIFTYSYSS